MGDVVTADPTLPIRTPRLELVVMSVPFMEALRRNDLRAAEVEAGANVPADMPDDLRNFLLFRLAQLAVDPSIREWLGRLMILEAPDGSRRVIGSIGFHGPPDEAGRVEVGYRVEPQYRRQGYAKEAVAALFDWAHRTHGIEHFIASISPTNEPSLRLASQFGFEQTGEQMDDIDGLELVFETTWPRSQGPRS